MDFLDLKYTHVLTYITRIMAHESIQTLLETFYHTGNFLKTHQHNDETIYYIGKILNGPKNIYIEVTIIKVFEESITDYVNELKC